MDAAGNLSDYSRIAERRRRPSPDTTAAVGARRPGRHRVRQQPGEPELDGLDRQRRGGRVPRRALPGGRLHELRPDRGADDDDLTDSAVARLDDISVPRAGGRRGRQLRRLLGHRAGDDRSGGSRPDVDHRGRVVQVARRAAAERRRTPRAGGRFARGGTFVRRVLVEATARTHVRVINDANIPPPARRCRTRCRCSRRLRWR